MAVTQTNASIEPRSFSLGPVKCQIVYLTIGAADTTATVTADALNLVQGSFLTGVVQTVAPTVSGNQITFTFVAPGGAGCHGQVLLLGR